MPDKQLIVRFLIIFLVCFILTTSIFLFTAILLNYGQQEDLVRPLPPFYWVVCISVLITVFIFTPWSEIFKTPFVTLSRKITTSNNACWTECRKKIASLFAGEKSPLFWIKTSVAKNKNPDISYQDAAYKFTTQIIETVKKCDKNYDIYTRIAANLLVAGGLEYLRSAYNLSDEDYKNVLELSSQTLVQRIDVPDTIKEQKFFDILNGEELEEYHKELIVAGEKAFCQTFNNNAEKQTILDNKLPDILSLWRDKITYVLEITKEEECRSKVYLTMMFTDITDSTLISKQKGELFTQHIFHIHNHIVRKALKNFGGREVKTLGDGLFAYFEDEVDATKAAVQIQQELDIYNKENPDGIFFVRIGLNSGRPIIEEGDLFGIAVQRAARICEKAAPAGIFISDEMKDILLNAGINLRDEGYFIFKGIKDKERVYSVIWK